MEEFPVLNEMPEDKEIPLFLQSAFAFSDPAEMEDVFAGKKSAHTYSRISNPNSRAFEEIMAELEGSGDAVATSSGMAAISSVIIGLCKTGDHIISSRALFGTTYSFFTSVLFRFGIEVSFADLNDLASLEKLQKKNTRLIYAETPSNPALKIIDLESLGKWSKEKNTLLVVDNTFATPALQQPLSLGADISLHSATKYIDGQGRVLGGVACGSQKLIEQIREFVIISGPVLSPFNARILCSGTRDLAERMIIHSENALAIAEMLSRHPKVKSVNYPFLPAHSGYETATRQMSGGGGIVSFQLNLEKEQVFNFLRNLRIFTLKASLGAANSLATHPDSSTHVKVPTALKEEMGINAQTIRLSVGTEDVSELLDDLRRGLDLL